jgi:RNAse (barnase) inhibitor barstar
MTLVKLDTRRITDWDSFHDVFAEALGFPGFYGRNMDAWIDCMTWLDDPSAEMTTVHALPGGVVVLQLEHVGDFARRCPEQYAAIIECSAFVNWRKLEIGEPAVLALSFYKGAE